MNKKGSKAEDAGQYLNEPFFNKRFNQDSRDITNDTEMSSYAWNDEEFMGRSINTDTNLFTNSFSCIMCSRSLFVNSKVMNCFMSSNLLFAPVLNCSIVLYF